MQVPSRGPGVKDSVAPMVGGTGASGLWVPGGFLTGGGHQGRCRAILRPGAGSRVDHARVGSLPKPPPPAPRGAGLFISPQGPPGPRCPSLSPCLGPYVDDTSPPLQSLPPGKPASGLPAPRPSAPCPTVTLLRACHAVWLRQYPLVCCLELLVCDLCVCVCAGTPTCACLCTRTCMFSSLTCHWSYPRGFRAPKERTLDCSSVSPGPGCELTSGHRKLRSLPAGLGPQPAPGLPCGPAA